MREAWSFLRSALLLSLAALMPVALLASTSILLASHQLTSEVEKRVQATASVSAVLVEGQTSAFAALVHSYASRPSVVKELTASPGLGPSGHADIGAALASLLDSSEGSSGAFVTDLDGTLTDVQPPTPAIVGRNFAFRDWYTGLTASGGPYVSTAYQTAVLGSDLVVAVSDFVRTPDGRPVAILAATLSLDAIQSVSEDIAGAQGIKLIVTDQAGSLLSAGGEDGLVSKVGETPVARALDGGTGLSEYAPQRSGARAGPAELSAYTPVTSTGWAVVTSVQRDVAFAGLKQLRRTVLAVAAVLGVVVVAGATAIAHAQRRRRESELAIGRRDRAVSQMLASTDEGYVSIDSAGIITAWSVRAERFSAGRPRKSSGG